MKYISILLLSVLMCLPVCAMVKERERTSTSESEGVSLGEVATTAAAVVVGVPILAVYGVGYGAWCGIRGIGSLFSGGGGNSDGGTEVIDVGGGLAMLRKRPGSDSSTSGGYSRRPGGSRRPGEWRNETFGETRRHHRFLTLREREQMQKTREENTKGLLAFLTAIFGYDKPDIDIDK